MIRTSRQLKALVRNMSKGDSTKAQIIIRNYVMERFLERLSLSSYASSGHALTYQSSFFLVGSEMEMDITFPICFFLRHMIFHHCKKP